MSEHSAERCECHLCSARRAFAMFGPGTTKGGRAEAGWLEVGTIAGEGIHIGPHDGRDSDASSHVAASGEHPR